MTPKFHSKHYWFTAKLVQQFKQQCSYHHIPNLAVRKLIDLYIKSFQEDNPKFCPEKFKKAISG